jgi:DNA-3-methyladenine glycosylase II
VTDADDAAAAARAHLVDDPALGPVVAACEPLSLSPAADPFERLLTSVVRQQVSSAAADVIEARLFDAVEPTPAAVLAADEATLREAGLSRQKVGYVRAIAGAFEERDWDRAAFEAMDDERVIEELTAVRGVGEWTAKMFLLFVLAREDVFPVGDLGVRAAMADRCGMVREDRAAMVERAEPWRPYRSYATLYLWNHYEDGDTGVGR